MNFSRCYTLLVTGVALLAGAGEQCHAGDEERVATAEIHGDGIYTTQSIRQIGARFLPAGSLGAGTV